MQIRSTTNADSSLRQFSLPKSTSGKQQESERRAASGPFETFQSGLSWLEDLGAQGLAKLNEVTTLMAAHPDLNLDIENDIKFDGFLLGAKGSFDTSNASEVEPVRPNNGKEADETVFLINGIMTDVALHQADMQYLANTGKNVVGIHNSTAGLVADIAQGLDDKFETGFKVNPATAKATALMYEAVTDSERESIHMIGHSHGALILSCVVGEVKEKLLADGLSNEEAEKALEKVKITTFGGAGRNFPDGPKYHHVINQKDLVAMAAGFGFIGYPGRGAEIHSIDVMKMPHDLPDAREGIQNWIARVVDRSTHGPQDIYFNHAPWLEEHKMIEPEVGLKTDDFAFSDNSLSAR